MRRDHLVIRGHSYRVFLFMSSASDRSSELVSLLRGVHLLDSPGPGICRDGYCGASAGGSKVYRSRLMTEVYCRTSGASASSSCEDRSVAVACIWLPDVLASGSLPGDEFEPPADVDASAAARFRARLPLGALPGPRRLWKVGYLHSNRRSKQFLHRGFSPSHFNLRP